MKLKQDICTDKKTRQNKAKLYLFLMCYISYTITYFCRLNFSAIMPELIKLNRFSAEQLGAVSSMFFITYGIGQLVNGFLGVKFNPKYMLFTGIFVSSLINITLFFISDFYVFIVLWGLNGYFQAMVWAPIVQLIGAYYNKEEKEKFGVNLSSTVPVGTVLSYAISLGVLLILPWNYVFLTTGVLLFIGSLLWLYGTKKVLPNINKVCDEYKEGGVEDTGNVKPKSSPPCFKSNAALFISIAILLFITGAVHGILKDGVTNWVPVYITDSFKTSTSLSLAFTMVLPVVNAAGGYLASFINKKINNEIKTSMALFIVSAAALLILWKWGKVNMFLTITCLSAVTCSMFGVNMLIVTFIPLYFSKYNKASLVSGIINSVAYLGCGISNYMTGKLISGYSFDATIILWAALSVFAVACAFVLSFLWKKFVNKIL